MTACEAYCIAVHVSAQLKGQVVVSSTDLHCRNKVCFRLSIVPGMFQPMQQFGERYTVKVLDNSVVYPALNWWMPYCHQQCVVVTVDTPGT